LLKDNDETTLESYRLELAGLRFFFVETDLGGYWLNCLVLMAAFFISIETGKVLSRV
jgi:hypothetical protein